MITIIANFDVKAEYIDSFIKCATDVTRETRKEKGCLSYKITHKRDDKSKFTFIEEWLNDTAIEAHNEAKHFKLFVEKIVPMLNGDIDIKQLEKLPSVFF